MPYTLSSLPSRSDDFAAFNVMLNEEKENKNLTKLLCPGSSVDYSIFNIIGFKEADDLLLQDLNQLAISIT